MPAPESTTYKPTEVWSTNPEAELDEAVLKARDEINRQNPDQLLERLGKSVEHSERGIAFAVLKGEKPEEYSTSEALVTFNPYANAATPNMLFKAEFIREAAKYADIRAEDGKLKPVIMLASPGLNGSKIRLSEADRMAIKNGELGPYAKELLHAVSEKEVGKVALLGFSQGADVALAGARQAYSANLDTQHLAAGDPAGVMKRSSVAIGLDFMKSGGLKPVVKAGGIPTQAKALGFGYGMQDIMTAFVPSVVFNEVNRRLWKGLGANTFEGRVQAIMDEGRVDKLVVGYGSKSAIAKPEAIEPSLERLQVRDERSILSTVRVEGGKHSWGDQLPLLAQLYMRALQ